MVATLGSQAGISIGVNDPSLAARPSPGVHGNLPVAPGVAVRSVGFWRSEAGYIDDPRRGLRDINRTTSFGGRLAVRVDDLDD